MLLVCYLVIHGVAHQVWQECVTSDSTAWYGACLVVYCMCWVYMPQTNSGRLCRLCLPCTAGATDGEVREHFCQRWLFKLTNTPFTLFHPWWITASVLLRFQRCCHILLVLCSFWLIFLSLTAQQSGGFWYRLWGGGSCGWGEVLVVQKQRFCQEPVRWWQPQEFQVSIRWQLSLSFQRAIFFRETSQCFRTWDKTVCMISPCGNKAVWAVYLVGIRFLLFQSSLYCHAPGDEGLFLKNTPSQPKIYQHAQ